MTGLHVATAIEFFHLHGLPVGIAFTGLAELGFFGGELLDDFLGRQVGGRGSETNR